MWTLVGQTWPPGYDMSASRDSGQVLTSPGVEVTCYVEGGAKFLVLLAGIIDYLGLVIRFIGGVDS